MVIRLMTFNAVPSSYEGRDITPLIDALRKAPEQISSQDRPAVIQLITSILATDFPPKVWNAAALALLKISPDNVSRLIGPILKRPDKAKEAGTLLYVIDKSDSSIPLDAAVNILENGSYEARAETLILLEKGRVEPFYEHERNEAQQRLMKLTKREDDTEVADAALLAINYIGDLMPTVSRTIANHSQEKAVIKLPAMPWNSFMVNEEHVALIRQGVDVWNAWRRGNPNVVPNLSGADLREADLHRVDLSETYLWKTDLNGADLSGAALPKADLTQANLSQANLRAALLPKADLRNADLGMADLSGADLRGADLREANLRRANLRGADLSLANISQTDLTLANFSGANVSAANLIWANLTSANLTGANLRLTNLVQAVLENADLSGSRVYGVSAWGLKLDGAKQENLIITAENEPEITVDNIEVAQFVYLLLHNQKIREVIDTVARKAVLILGRFTPERKAVLDAIREELREHDYLPILFDFDVPTTRDITETVSLLARMARFIIADLTNPSSIPKELEAIVPHLAVPVQPLLEGSARPFAMFKDYWKYDWVLQPYRYEGLDPLLASLADKVIAPAEAKVKALEEKRRMIEEELTKPQ